MITTRSTAGRADGALLRAVSTAVLALLAIACVGGSDDADDAAAEGPSEMAGVESTVGPQKFCQVVSDSVEGSADGLLPGLDASAAGIPGHEVGAVTALAGDAAWFLGCLDDTVSVAVLLTDVDEVDPSGTRLTAPVARRIMEAIVEPER